MPFDTLCVPTLPTEKYTDHGDTFECDYDKNPTSLYEAIEARAWIPGFNFFSTGKWEKGIFFAPVVDPISPERQARTWVTRFETDGKVRWSQLPIHAAVIFGAPYQFLTELVKLFPQGVRSTDDQHMLPLHLAIKYGAEDSVVSCLLETFPESIFTKDIRGRLPSEVDSLRPERSQIIEHIITIMAKTLTRRHGETMDKNINDLKDDLVLQNNLNMELERDKNDMEQKWKKAEAEIKFLKGKMDALKAAMKKETAQETKQSLPKREGTMLAARSKTQLEQKDASRRVSRSYPTSTTTNTSSASPTPIPTAFAQVQDRRPASQASSSHNKTSAVSHSHAPQGKEQRESSSGIPQELSSTQQGNGTAGSTATSNGPHSSSKARTSKKGGSGVVIHVGGAKQESRRSRKFFKNFASSRE